MANKKQSTNEYEEFAADFGIDLNPVASLANNTARVYFILRRLVVDKKVKAVKEELAAQGTSIDYDEIKFAATEAFYDVFGKYDASTKTMVEPYSKSPEFMLGVCKKLSGCDDLESLLAWEDEQQMAIKRRVAMKQRTQPSIRPRYNDDLPL